MGTKHDLLRPAPTRLPDARTISQLVNSGQAPFGEFAQQSRARIAELEPGLHAWSFMSTASASKTAIAHTLPTGNLPLAGVPFGVKDVIDVTGMPTGCGTPLHGHSEAPYDAVCVALLRRAGAIPVGKTVTAEFAYAFPGPTRNPWNSGHTPGGSSSGSAAAVASGSVPLALGTQTGGSIIRPAAYCGVVGFKPTLKRVNAGGIKLLSPTLDTPGFFSRTVEDASLAASVIVPGCSVAAPKFLAPRNLYVAAMRCEALGPLQAEAKKVFESAARTLQQAGASVSDLSHDHEFQTLSRLHGIVMKYEMARSLLPEWSASPSAFSPVLAALLKQGWEISDEEHQRALALADELKLKWQDKLKDYDCVLTPSAEGPAPAGLSSTGQSTFNRVWTLLGWPALHLPLDYSNTGLPLGVQLVGKHGQDFSLLQMGALLHPLLDKRPSKDSVEINTTTRLPQKIQANQGR
ncbi:amidase [Ottowia thiooxydans]|uniref:amidase n=1 Tax=Ottowia thiooxydans TaxID=219182 RepID=UPI00146F2ECB|nr:amidase [Ottowia thiooxydans]